MADILTGISGGGRLVFAWIFPSAIAIAVLYAIAIGPTGLDATFGLRGLSFADQLVILAVGATFLGVAMTALYTPLYRLLEGYSWPARLQAWGRDRQRARRDRLQRAAKAAEEGLANALATEALNRFPRSDDQLAPTQLGNAMRAFETYGVETYRLDSQSFWTELAVVATDALRRELSNARAGVDFFVALTYLSVVTGLLCVVSGLVTRGGANVAVVAIGVGIAATAFFWYRCAVTSSSYWDTTVRALVNLGRKPFAEALGLVLPAGIDKEREMWTLVTAFTFYGYEAVWADQLDEFRAQSSSESRPDADQEEGAGAAGATGAS